jgi:site-specific DNA-methyltransferase (adenine-specific)
VWYGPLWGRIQGNNKERRKNHQNQIPEVYLERVIRACSDEGQLVLDPFLGSGTTCTVARALLRRSIGIEYSRRNAASAFERIQSGPIRLGRSLPATNSFMAHRRRLGNNLSGDSGDPYLFSEQGSPPIQCEPEA